MEVDVNEDEPEVIRVDPVNEPNILITQFGRNEMSYVELFGWTKNIPLSVPGLKEQLNIKSVRLVDPVVQREGYLAGNEVTKLAELQDYGSDKYAHFKVDDNGPFDKPLLLRVLSKNIGHVFKGKSSMSLGFLNVGDESGYTTLVTFNEAIATLWDHVTLGDSLLIFKCQFKHKPKRPPEEKSKDHATLWLSPHHHLCIELKCSQYECRHVFKVIDESLRKPFSGIYVNPSHKLRLPSDFLNWVQVQPTPSDNDETVAIKYFDIVGFVTYVGPWQRRRNKKETVTVGKQSDLVACPVRFDYEKDIYDFIAERWIQITDLNMNTEQILMRLRLNKDLLLKQKSLVPGSVITVTNCFYQQADVFKATVNSSSYSQIFVNHDIRKYFALFPTFLKSAAAVVSLENYKKLVLQWKNEFTIGGMLPLAIHSEHAFRILVTKTLAMSATTSQVDSSSQVTNGKVIDPDQHEFSYFKIPLGPLFHRELQVILGRGFILKYEVVERMDKRPCPQKRTFLDLKRSRKCLKTMENFENHSDPDLYDSKERSHWISFRRQLPVVEHDIDSERGGLLQYTDNFEKSYSGFCDAYAVPSGTTLNTRDLPIVGGLPFCLVYIIDEANKMSYTCSMRSLPLSVQQDKLNAVKNSYIYFRIEILCGDEESQSKNVILHDFIKA